MTKYEKVGKDFLAKIKTRIICLLDLDRIKHHLNLSDIGKLIFMRKSFLCYIFVFFQDVTLYPENRQIDSEGDKQLPLTWKTRTIMSSENRGRIFHYVELKENDFVKLRKTNVKGKPLYNNGLCRLKFEIKFTVRVVGLQIEVPIILMSQLFGLCSHAKYCSKYLAQVFIAEVNQMYADVSNIYFPLNNFIILFCC